MKIRNAFIPTIRWAIVNILVYFLPSSSVRMCVCSFVDVHMWILTKLASCFIETEWKQVHGNDDGAASVCV